jgi:hypothetical protein
LNDGIFEPTVRNAFPYDKYFLARLPVPSAAIAYGMKIILVFINRIECVLEGVTACFHNKFLPIF